MQSLIRHFREQSDLVVIDTPPALAVADAAILSTMVDGVILVCDPNKTKRRDLRHAREAVKRWGRFSVWSSTG
jgi:Mrp family chromosome partitioning ATPase